MQMQRCMSGFNDSICLALITIYVWLTCWFMSGYYVNISCLTLNTFICQRKSQINLRKTRHLKNLPNVGRGKCCKKLPAKSTNIKTIQLSHSVNGLIRNRKNTHPPNRWVRVEYTHVIWAIDKHGACAKKN